MPLIITREDLERMKTDKEQRDVDLERDHFDLYDGFTCPDCGEIHEACKCGGEHDENHYSCPHCLLPWEDCDCDDNPIIKE